MSGALNGGDGAAILREVAAYYAAKLAEHGPTPRGVDWNSQASHELRHRQFVPLLRDALDASILDLGCGYGDFYRFLRGQDYRGMFIGYDIAPEMVAAAVGLHGEGPDRRWRLGAEPAETADFAIASGIFNVKNAIPAETWARYVRSTIDILARAGRRGFAFNALSLASSDPARRRADLFYADPAAMRAHCLGRYGGAVTLLDDYGLHEFTLIVTRN